MLIRFSIQIFQTLLLFHFLLCATIAVYFAVSFSFLYYEQVARCLSNSLEKNVREAFILHES